MDEIAVLAALRPTAADFPAADRVAARQHLLTAIAQERASAAQAGPAGREPTGAEPAGAEPAGTGPSRRWTTRRIGVAGAALAALTATAVGLMIALPGAGTSHIGRPGPPSTGTVHGSAPATAAGMLLLAARVADGSPTATPGPRQFVYTEQLIKGHVEEVNSRTETVPAYLQRTWMSVNGMWGGLARARYVKGGRWVTNELPVPVCAIPRPSDANWKANCPVPPGYVTTLPTTVAGMRAYLLKKGGLNGPLPYRILTGIAGESWQTRLLVPDHSYALMFRAAATVKGIRLIRHATSAAGKPGIAVAACVPPVIQKGSMPGWHGCAERIELIFDATTYRFTGGQETQKGSPTPGTTAEQALLKIAIVDKLGQVP